MESSSKNPLDVVTSLDSCLTKDLRNHSSRNTGGIDTLIKFFQHLHSQMWLEIWFAFVCSKLANNSVLVSYLKGNWKWFRNAIANLPKKEYLKRSSSMYHFATLPMRVHWNNHNCRKLYFNELDENQRWKVVTWSPRYSLCLALNFGMSKGNLVVIGG